MIDFISGKIAELSPTKVTVENNGIGYCMEISLQTYSSLEGKKESTVFIQSQVNPREGTCVEYGFSSKEERNMFRLLTSVSGMGANSTRMVLSSLSNDELKGAILSENISSIKSVKGIGLKTAQRIILELKDKIAKGEGNEAPTLLLGTESKTTEEASSALLMLGFSKPNINKAIQQILKANPSASVEQIIKTALKML